jgi:hypothetical protein
MRRILEICVVVALVATACSGGDVTTTSVTSPEATTSSTTLPVTTSTTMPATTTTATTTTVVLPDPLLGVEWSRVVDDPSVSGVPGWQEMMSVTAGGPGLVAVGYDASGSDGHLVAAVWTSTDGRVWSRVLHDEAVFGGPGELRMSSVIVGGPGLVAVGSADGYAAVWTSVDGLVWSRVPHDVTVFGGSDSGSDMRSMSSVTVGGPGLVAVGSADGYAAVWTSVDGLVWSQVPHDHAVFAGPGWQGMTSVTTGGPGFVAVGRAWPDAGDVVAAVWTSTDGRVWSRVPHDEAVFGGLSDQVMSSVTAGGPGLVAVGQDWSGGHGDAAVWTSVDGLVWSRVPHDEAVFGGPSDRLPSERSMSSVTAGGPGLVAVGYDWSGGDQDGAVWLSTDGLVWSRVPRDRAVFGGPSIQSMLAVAAGGPGLVAVGCDSSGDDQDAAVWVSPPMR